MIHLRRVTIEFDHDRCDFARHADELVAQREEVIGDAVIRTDIAPQLSEPAAPGKR